MGFGYDGEPIALRCYFVVQIIHVFQHLGLRGGEPGLRDSDVQLISSIGSEWQRRPGNVTAG